MEYAEISELARRARDDEGGHEGLRRSAIRVGRAVARAGGDYGDARKAGSMIASPDMLELGRTAAEYGALALAEWFRITDTEHAARRRAQAQREDEAVLFAVALGARYVCARGHAAESGNGPCMHVYRRRGSRTFTCGCRMQPVTAGAWAETRIFGG